MKVNKVYTGEVKRLILGHPVKYFIWLKWTLWEIDEALEKIEDSVWDSFLTHIWP